ncbi:MAG: ThuA domain-containing protein [Verrucomicrobiae bacterium]|nr:ThuA domain-containing protein [Verrucomicrobiae bacterium]
MAAESGLPQAELDRIAAALPHKAWAKPRKPRRLLIFERNVNYGGHRSISTATTAFRLMGEKTGAFSVVAGSDPELFRRDHLATVDGVFFNNNVGNLFTDATLRENLAEFVFSGGGLMGVHGATVAFTQWPGAIEDWPEFGLMIGARGANHRESTEPVVMKIEEPGHPLVQAFPGTHFEYRDEYFRVHEPYSRKRLRVLLSMDLERMPLAQGPAYGQVERPDRDYAVAWAREYGRGRCFYCTIAHNPYVFWEPVLLSFYLAAAQFILGDWPAPVTPSARLTPAVKALEKLGWRLGFCGARERTVWAGIASAERLGLLCVTAGMMQPLGEGLLQPFDANLSSEHRRQLRFKLDAAGVRLLACETPELPADEAQCRAVFDFARRMGCELLVVPASRVGDISKAAKCAVDAEVRLAVRPDAVQPLMQAQKVCQLTPAEVGVWWDCTYGVARSIAPRRAVLALRERLLAVEIGHAGQAGECLPVLKEQGIRPVMIAVSLTASALETTRACEQAVLSLVA